MSTNISGFCQSMKMDTNENRWHSSIKHWAKITDYLKYTLISVLTVLLCYICFHDWAIVSLSINSRMKHQALVAWNHHTNPPFLNFLFAYLFSITFLYFISFFCKQKPKTRGVFPCDESPVNETSVFFLIYFKRINSLYYTVKDFS